MIDPMECLCDTLIPGDLPLGLPPGSSVDFSAYVEEYAIGDEVAGLMGLLDALARETCRRKFTDLDLQARLDCVTNARRKDARLANAVIIHFLKAYYTDAAVLRSLRAGAVPPFPEGNRLEEDDWTILEPVYERGPIYRPLPP